MASGDRITRLVADLVKEHGTRDPFALAEALDIAVYFSDRFDKLKGMYAVIEGRRCIFINSNLDEPAQKLVCAHEIGHDRLHFEQLGATPVIHEEYLYDSRDRSEFEANLFAADLLIRTDELEEYARQGMSIAALAATFGYDEQVINFKLLAMRRQGYDIPDTISWNTKQVF